jgi:hypothetical protein
VALLLHPWVATSRSRSSPTGPWWAGTPVARVWRRFHVRLPGCYPLTHPDTQLPGRRYGAPVQRRLPPRWMVGRRPGRPAGSARPLGRPAGPPRSWRDPQTPARPGPGRRGRMSSEAVVGRTGPYPAGPTTHLRTLDDHCLFGRPADPTGRWPCPGDSLVGTAPGRLQAKSGALAGGASRCWGRHRVRRSAQGRLAGFGIAENM